MAPFLDIAEPTIYAIKDAAAHLGLLRNWDSQLAACAQDIAERTVKSHNGTGLFGIGDGGVLLADGAFKYLFHSQEDTLTMLYLPSRPNSGG